MRIKVNYTNWKGETRLREIRPVENGLFFGTTAHHQEPQWLIRVIDLEKNAERIFALRDCDFRTLA